MPALKAAIEDLKAGRLQAGWDKLDHYGVIKEVIDGVEMRQRAGEQHLGAFRAGKTSLMISPRHEEARKVAAVVRQQLKAESVIGVEDYTVTVLRRMNLAPEARHDLLHYEPGRVIGFHTRTARGFKAGEKWTVSETDCYTVTLVREGLVCEPVPELGTRCTSTRVIRQRYVNRCCSLESASQCGSLSKLRNGPILSRDMQ